MEYCQQTLALKKTLESGFLTLAERLKKIKEEGLWEAEWGSFAEFLMEMKISEATASKLISVYDKFVLEYGIDQEKLAGVGWSSLYEILPLCDTVGSAREMVEKATLLKRDELREEVREARVGECDHEWVEVHLRQCTKCAKREKIDG